MKGNYELHGNSVDVLETGDIFEERSTRRFVQDMMSALKAHDSLMSFFEMNFEAIS
jgi:hypothetical protein